MDRIKLLYNHLSPSEIRSLVSYLKLVQGKGAEKPLKLLKMIEKDPGLSMEDASLKLYGESNSKSFGMMKYRLYEKMSEFMILSLNPESTKYSRDMPYFKDLIDFRKNILEATIMQERRIPELARMHFRSALEIAQKCQTPELEIDALIRLRANLKFGDPEFDELSSAISNALVRQERDINALGIYQKFLSLFSLHTAEDSEKIEYLEKHLPGLEEDLRQKTSIRAEYYFLMLRANYYKLLNNFEKTRETLEKVIALVEENAGIRSQQRRSDPLFQLGMLYLKFYHFDNAVASFKKIESYLKENSFATYSNGTLLAYSYFHLGEFEESGKLVDQLLEEINEKSDEPWHKLSGMLLFLKACIAFQKGDFITSTRIMNQNRDIHFDKKGWVTGARIFELMTLIEMKDFDYASTKIENLRKHLARHPAEGREAEIFRLLVDLEKSGFIFKSNSTATKRLELLEKELHWDPVGHEVIRFDDWYKSKINHD